MIGRPGPRGPAHPAGPLPASGDRREPPGPATALVDVEQVVRSAGRGDAAAMDALVRALMPYVGRVCGAIALDRGEDAMQDTFVAVLRNIGSLREPGALYGWVRRIAVRESIRVARAGRRATPVASLDLGGVPSPAVEESVDVRATLAALAPEHRAVLVLRDVEGLTEAEVAELLGVPEGTVKSRLHRARAAFARRWGR